MIRVKKGELMASMLGNVIQFFDKIGIYEVVMPFLLTFTIVFAILEKTKVLGTEGDKNGPRKNINALVAFVIGFMVIASAQLVQIVTQVSSQVVILILLIVFFLTLVGTFYKPTSTGETVPGNWQTFFLFFMFIGILFIFLAAIKTQNGYSWLEIGINYLANYWSSTAVASILLIIVIIATVWWITKKEE